MFQVGKGALHRMMGNHHAIANIIPVDTAINMMIAACWFTGTHRWVLACTCMWLCGCMFKSINGPVPSYLAEQILRYEPVRLLRSADKELLVVPKIRKDLWD